MKTIKAVLLFSLILLGAGMETGSAYADSGSPAAGFFSEIEDFPLMPGMEELPDATLIFDSPSGRFVEAYAFGRITASDLRTFYAASLPQLGWQPAGPSVFQREGELLEITIVGPVADDGSQTVRFAISPSGGGTNSN